MQRHFLLVGLLGLCPLTARALHAQSAPGPNTTGIYVKFGLPTPGAEDARPMFRVAFTRMRSATRPSTTCRALNRPGGAGHRRQLLRRRAAPGPGPGRHAHHQLRPRLLESL